MFPYDHVRAQSLISGLAARPMDETLAAEMRTTMWCSFLFPTMYLVLLIPFVAPVGITAVVLLHITFLAGAVSYAALSQKGAFLECALGLRSTAPTVSRWAIAQIALGVAVVLWDAVRWILC